MTKEIFIILLSCFTYAYCVAPICEKNCTCYDDVPSKNFISVDCSRTHMSQVPPVDNWPENATFLDLSGNDITALNVEIVHKHLTIFKLNYNRISKIVPSAFGGLNNLKYLDLSNNILRTLDGNVFYGLEALRVLNISNNQFKTFPDNIFYNLLDLEELSISGNPIVYIDPVHFNRNLNLKRLGLSNIAAYSLPPKLFYMLSELEYLDLSINDFHEVPIEALRGAKKLKWLKLNMNPIDSLDKKSFIKMNSLEILIINYMDKLDYIGPQTFSDLVNLKILHMRYNKNLRTIDKGAFQGIFNNNSVPVLQELDLEKNQLTTMEEFPCSKMQIVNLQKNPWSCDCRIKWIKRCEISMKYTADLTCYSPSLLRGRLLVNTPEEDFACVFTGRTAAQEAHRDRVMRALSLVLGAGLLLVLFGLILLMVKWKKVKSWWRLRKRGPGAVYYVRARSHPTST